MSARMSMFKNDLHKSLLSNSSQTANYLSSVCLSADVSINWLHQGINYSVKGPRSKELSTFANCFKIATKVVKNKISAPAELIDKNIYAFSFYFDRLRSANILEESGGVVQLSEILSKSLLGENFKIDSIIFFKY